MKTLKPSPLSDATVSPQFDVSPIAGQSDTAAPFGSALGFSGIFPGQVVPFVKPQAYTITWVNAAGGDWATAANWSTGVLPGPTDNVGISTSQQQTITHLSGSDTVNSLAVGNDLFVIYDSSLAITSGATFGYQLQIDGGDLYLGAGNATIGALAIYGDGSPFVTDGDLDGTGTVTVTGNALLGDGTGGVMTGAGTTLIDGNSTISAGIGGQPIGAFFGLDGGRVLQNAGTMTWTGGDIVLGFGSGGGTIENLASGTFDIATASSMSSLTGITGLENAGLLEQTGITGQSDIGAPLTNTGSIAVDLGTLSLDDGGVSAASAISVAAGAMLAIGGGTFTANTGGSLSLAGALAINGGLLELGAENATIGTYIQSAALDGTGTVTVTGTAALVGYAPTISGAGTLLLKGSTTVNGNVSLNAGRLLENAGTLTWIGDSFTLGSGYGGGTITNAAGAIFDIEVNSAIVSNVGPTVFNNAGLLKQQMTSGTTSLYVPFVNTGTVDILTGVLALNGGGTSSASAFTVAAGAELAFIDNGGPSVFTFTGGTLNIAGSTLIGDGELDASAAKVTSFGSTLTLNAISNGAGYNYPAYLELGSQSITLDNLVETNGTIDGSGNVTVTASTLFNGEAIQTGTGTTLLDGATTIDGNLALANDRIVDNAGTLTWTGGSVQLGLDPYATSIGGGNVVNAKGAVVDIENPVTMTVSGGNCAFTNNGLLEQTETTGETDLYAPFTNSSTGTVSVLSGTLSFDGGGTSAAGAFHVAAGAALGFNLDENTTSTFTMTGGTYNVVGTTAISNGLLNLSAAKIASFGSLLYLGVSGAIELGGQSTTVNALEIDGPRYSPLAAIYGTGTLTVSGNAIFNQSFVMAGTGTIMLDGQSTLTAGYSAFYLDGGYVLANAGTLSLYSSWDLVLGVTDGGGTIDNLARGVIDIETDGEIDGNLGTTQFLNAGTLVQASTVGGTTSVTTAFTNTGSVDVQAGFLSLDAGGSSSASALTVAAGATLGFGAADRTAATFTLTGGSLNIAGALQLGSGTLELGAQNQTAANYNQTGGDLDCKGTFTITGNTDLVGGTFLQSGLGTTVIAGTGVLNSAYLFLDAGRTLENTGQLTIEGGGQLGLGINPFGSNVGGATLINAANATINIETNELINNATGATILRNAGLLEQTLAIGQTPFDVPVSSTGTIDVQSGSMAFNDGGSSFSGLIDGAGQISFNGASVFKSLTIGGTAALTNTGSIAQTGLVTLGDSTGAIASLTNTAGAIYTIAGSTLALGKGASVFTNNGSLLTTGGTNIDPSVMNTGLISAGSGALYFLGALTNSGTISVTGGAVRINESVSGTGMLSIGAAGLLSLGGAVASTQTVTFLTANGTLHLSDPLLMAASIADFVHGDVIDLLDKASTGFTFANDTLTVLSGKTAVAHLLFDGSYQSSNFTLASDTHGGTDILHT